MFTEIKQLEEFSVIGKRFILACEVNDGDKYNEYLPNCILIDDIKNINNYYRFVSICKGIRGPSYLKLNTSGMTSRAIKVLFEDLKLKFDQITSDVFSEQYAEIELGHGETIVKKDLIYSHPLYSNSDLTPDNIFITREKFTSVLKNKDTATYYEDGNYFCLRYNNSELVDNSNYQYIVQYKGDDVTNIQNILEFKIKYIFMQILDHLPKEFM